MNQVDWKLLRRRIFEASLQSLQAFRASHCSESIYAFALYTVDEGVGINPSINTEEAYLRTVEKQTADIEQRTWLESHGISFSDNLLSSYRWSCFDWEYECFGVHSPAFDAIYKMINNRGGGFYDESDPLGFEKFKAGVFASMVLALHDLDEEGLFGSDDQRNSLTVFCSVPASYSTVWFEQDSALRLNPSVVYERFQSERIKLISDGSENEACIIRDIYLSLVNQEIPLSKSQTIKAIS